MTVAEARPITTTDLCAFLENFVRDAERSRVPAERWLGSVAKEQLRVARMVQSGRLDAPAHLSLRNFRLAEIDKRRADKHGEIEALDREARSIEQEREPK